MATADRAPGRLSDRQRPSQAVAAAVLALLACLWGGESLARGPEQMRAACERRLPPGRVQVRTDPVEPVVESRLSYAELTRLAGREGDGRWVLGLTRPALQVEAQWGFSSLSDPLSGLTCLRPSLTMTLRYRPVQVYVASEFIDDSCAYDFVFRHEMRHVDVHVRRLREVALQLQAELQDRLAGVVHVGRRDDLQARLQSEVTGRWLPRAERDLQDVRREHQIIDSPEEYERAQTVCEGRIARHLRRAGRSW